MVTDNHYRWDFIGLSTDSKPTPATSEKVTDGSTFYCSDNSKLYVWYNNQWYEKTVSAGTTYTAGDGINIQEGVISANIANNLTTTTAGSALDARQGKALNDKINGYVKSSNIASNAWLAIPPEANNEPFTYYTELNISDYTITNNTSVELINNNAVLFAKYGFAIVNVDVEYQTVTIIAIGQPDSSVNLTMIFRD